jgi:uncharacterized protein
MKELIDRTQKFLYDHLCGSNYSDNEIKYRYDHSLRVTNIGLALCGEEDADKKITAIGCLLHDVGKFDTEDNMEHGRVSAKVARGFLETLDLTENEIDDICYAIAVHVDGKSGYDYEETLESKIVSDSDNIDRFGANRIQQSTIWELNDGDKSIEEKIKGVEKLLEKLNRYYNGNILETESGNKKFKEQLALQIHFYNSYLDELKITKVPEL